MKNMAMRSQVYEWANLTSSGTSQIRRSAASYPVTVTANREYDLFIGGIGNNITKPAETTATIRGNRGYRMFAQPEQQHPDSNQHHGLLPEP